MDTILLRDIAVLMTSDHFKKGVTGVAIPRSLRRIEYPVKMEVSSRSASEVTKGLTVKNNTVIILPKENEDVFYIPFLLDSLYVKAVLLGWNANVRKLGSLPIIKLSSEDKEYFCKLESMLLAIKVMGEERIGYEYFYAAERLFADIRDALSFEMYLPELVHNDNIYLIENWKQEVNKLRENQIDKGYEELVALINSLLKPNNALYDNLKRYYLLLSRIKK